MAEWWGGRLKAVAAGVASLVILAFVLIVCGGPEGDDGASGTPAGTAQPPDGGYAGLSGSVVIDGSSTVGPIAEAAAEEFGKVSDVSVTVGISGTSGGFEKFCRGETDISDASRPIKDSEKDACAAAGIEFVEIAVGIDGLTVAVHPDNDWATCLTWSQLRAIWDQGSAVDNWNDIDPSFPDEALVLFSPGADSGTFDYFTEQINGTTDQLRNDDRVTFSEDDNVLVQGVQNNKGAMAYFGYAYYAENADTLKALEVDGGAGGEAPGCVAPTDDAINDGRYSLSRPLLMYVARGALTEKPQVRGFMDFVLRSPDLVRDVGYVPLTDDAYEEGLRSLEAR
jgi:phosphate transport system substrate-binding protein